MRLYLYLKSSPKIIENGTGKTQNKEGMPQFDNINKLYQTGDKSDYIFGRLKRDAELGDEKAQKGTLVYTDIPLVQKLESAPKVNLHQRPETQKDEDIDKGVNINTLKSRSDTQDYIFGRLKRGYLIGSLLY